MFLTYFFPLPTTRAVQPPPTIRRCARYALPSVRAVANGGENRTVAALSTVAEIESALEKLPVAAQHEVAAWLETKLWPGTPGERVGLELVRLAESLAVMPRRPLF